MAQVVTRRSDEGPAYWFLGGLYEVLVSGEESGGAVTVMCITVPAGSASPPHTHSGGEVINVLDGQIRVHVGDDVVEGGPGSSFHYPAGTLEWFEASTQATIVATYLPGGIDEFFAEVGDRAPSRELPPPSGTPPDLARIASVGARYGLEIQPG